MHTRTHIHSVFGYLVFFPRLTQDCSRFYTTEPLGITRQVFPPPKKKNSVKARNGTPNSDPVRPSHALASSFLDPSTTDRRVDADLFMPAFRHQLTSVPNAITKMSLDISVGLVYEP